jgi:hypothetical protein
MRALVNAKAITVTPPKTSGAKPFLVVELSISCDTCGEHTVLVAGHHLRPIVALFQEVIDASPDLTSEGDVEVVWRRPSGAGGSFNPEDN